MQRPIVILANGRNRLLDLCLSGLDPVSVSVAPPGRGKMLGYARPRDIVRYGASIAFVLGVLRSLNPAVVVLSERDDTRNILITLYRELPDVKFISLQSVWFFESAHLHLFWPGDRRRLKILTWGQATVDLAARQGRDTRGRYAVGSLEAAIFSEFVSNPKELINESQICLVAKRKFGSETSVPTEQAVERRRNVETLIRYVDRYCQDSGSMAVIPVDPRRTGDEQSVDQDWLDSVAPSSNVKFSRELPALRVERPDWFPTDSVLPALDEFRALAIAAASVAVIGNPNSAIIWETLALGLPTLAVGFGNHKFFEFPISGAWALQDPTFETFAAQVCRISKVPNHRCPESEIAETRYLVQEPSSRMIHTLRQLVLSAQAGENWKE